MPVLDQTDRNTLHRPSQQLSSCQAGRKPGHTARSAENKRNDASSVSTVLPVTESDSTDFQWTTSQYSRTQTTLNLEQQPLVTEEGSYAVLISAIALPRSALLFYKKLPFRKSTPMRFAPQNQLTLVSRPLAVMDSQHAKNSAAIKLPAR